MRALLTIGHGGREQLVLREDYPKPAPAPGECLIKVAYSAINFHDIFTRRGMPGIKIPLPLVVGSDVSGTIAALGDGVVGFSVGERVLIDPFCRTLGKIGLIGEVRDGGRAEYLCAPAEQLIALPDGVSLEHAATLPLAYATALRMLEKGAVKAGEKVLVLGASGGVGVACVQLAHMMSAEVIACASTEDKLARLSQLGARHLINYQERNFADAVKEICGKPRATGGGGVDVAVNFTGGDTWLDTQKCVNLGGRILSCGATAGAMLQMDSRFLWTFEHVIIGSRGWERSDLVRLLDMIAKGKLSPVIDAILPLEHGAEAERRLEDREVLGKILLQP